MFPAHSVRCMLTSKANNIGLSIKDIESAAGWNACSTLREFYKHLAHCNFGKKFYAIYIKLLVVLNEVIQVGK